MLVRNFNLFSREQRPRKQHKIRTRRFSPAELPVLESKKNIDGVEAFRRFSWYLFIFYLFYCHSMCSAFDSVHNSCSILKNNMEIKTMAACLNGLPYNTQFFQGISLASCSRSVCPTDVFSHQCIVEQLYTGIGLAGFLLPASRECTSKLSETIKTTFQIVKMTQSVCSRQ